MNQNLKRIVILALSCCALNNHTFGQANIDGYFINPKIGIYNWLENDAGGIVGIETGVFKRHTRGSISYFAGAQILGSQRMNALNVSIGKFIGDKTFRLEYQAGLGMLWGNSSDEFYYQENRFFTVGIPVKVGVKLIPFKFLGIGFDLEANLNPVNSMYAPMLSLEFGRLK